MTDFTGFAVLGAGNLGVAVTINVKIKGEVAYLTPVGGHRGNIPAIEKAGGTVSAQGDLTGTHNIDTAELKDVLTKVKDLAITIVADGHPDLIRELARMLDLRKYTLVFMPGGHGPALVNRITLPERAPRMIITLGNSPWVARFDAPSTTLHTPGIKKSMPVSISYRRPVGVPISVLNDKIMKAEADLKINALIPEGEEPVPMAPALVFLCEANPTIHVAVMLEGADEIKKGLKLPFYRKLATKPEALAGIKAADLVRQQIAHKLAPGSWPDCDVLGLLQKYYDHDIVIGEDEQDVDPLARYFETAPFYKDVASPAKMAVRQLTEDGELQHILVHIAKKLGIDAAPMEDQMARTERELGYKLGNSPINPFTLGLIDAHTPEEIFDALNGHLPFVKA